MTLSTTRSLVTALAFLASGVALAEVPRIKPLPLPMRPTLGPQLPQANERAGDRTEDDSDASEEDGGAGGAGSESADRSAARRSSDDAAGGATGDAADGDVSIDTSGSSRQKPPVIDPNARVTIDFVDTPLQDIVKYFAEITGRNFILGDDLKGSVTIISHRPVSVPEAYEAFLSALEVEGYTTVTVGAITKVVASTGAANSPLRVYEGGNIPYTDNYVTQIIQLESVSVTDVSSVVKDLAGKGAKVIAYAPTNTLIITDAAVNIRRVYRIVSQLDVASPKARMEIIPLAHATASEVEKVIEELYGAEDTSSKDSRSSRSSSSARDRRKRTRDRNNKTAAPDSSATATAVGSEERYIERIISDERTNSLIVMANDEAMEAVRDLIAELDIDVDPASRAQIRVVYLEHAKAEDIAQVLSQLSETQSSSQSSRNRRTTRDRRGPSNERSSSNGPFGRGSSSESADGSSTSVVAAFDSGVRITSDENTNSLVIIAVPDQFRILKQVIDQLDVRRKQVFVECVILELASDNTDEFGLGIHAGAPRGEDGFSVGSAQLGGSSMGLSQDLLSGLALGVFGDTIEVPLNDLTTGESSMLSVPAFGVAVNALQSNASVNILSTPNILTMDNEEAKIVVGRNIPFPVSTGRDNNNNPIISYQREDVAITLKVTPQINESNYVTLQLFQEVQEIEEDDSGLDVNSAGFITSKRQVENTVVVKDNQTIVIGGLVGETETNVATKIPILGDLPLLGRLFRGHRNTSRKTNMLIFLTPHIIDEPADLEEVYQIKWAQRQEFMRRFYGKSREQQEAELLSLMSYSMNRVGQPSRYRGPVEISEKFQVIGGPAEPVTPPAPESEAPTSDPDASAPADAPSTPEDGE